MDGVRGDKGKNTVGKIGDPTEGFLHYLFSDDLREVAYLSTFQFSLLKLQMKYEH